VSRREALAIMAREVAHRHYYVIANFLLWEDYPHVGEQDWADLVDFVDLYRPERPERVDLEEAEELLAWRSAS
jgi:hypothetical protein